MIDPTPEQIEAGRQAVLANFHPPTDLKPTWHLNPEEVARAVLAAAAGAAPQEPTPAPSKYINPSLPGMIRNLWKSDPSEASVRTALGLAGDLIQELIDLRAAPVQVDEAKLASLLQEHRPSQWRSFDNDTIVYRCCGQDFGRLTGKPRKADRDPRELWEEHMASILADSLRGEGQ